MLNSLVQLEFSADSHNCLVYFFKSYCVVEGYFAYLLLAFVARNFIANVFYDLLLLFFSLGDIKILFSFKFLQTHGCLESHGN